MKKIAILGSTGSIGRSTLSVVESFPERFEVVSLAAGSNLDLAFEQGKRWKPRIMSMATEPDAAALRTRLIRADLGEIEVVFGSAGTVRVATLTEANFVVSAIVGVAGLEATYEAVRAGKSIGLANKECLVAAGELITAEAHKQGKPLLPIDSEHNAVFQSLPRHFGEGLANVGVRKIILTASGGPFRSRLNSELHSVTPDEACAHPNWVMGRKISVDSATMMYKGLEVIEAHWLFNADAEMIEVVIHPQSIVHSMVEYLDGSVIAQLGNPDMRTPIAYGLGFPDRIDAGVSTLDLTKAGSLEFSPIDTARFPCVRLAYDALKRGGTAPVVLNAANEIAVDAFLNGALKFTDIAMVIEDVLSRAAITAAAHMGDVFAADANARAAARERIARFPIQQAATA